MFPRHVERFNWVPNKSKPPTLTEWPYTIPAVAQLMNEGGFDVPPGITFLVGENGSGKSTLIEAFAETYPRGGHETSSATVVGPEPSREDSPLARHLRPRLHRFASPAGFFLRAESMHNFLREVDERDGQGKSWGHERLQERSHGESFLAVLKHRFNEQGVYFMDEPEAALSFESCLGLLVLLDAMRKEGSQVLIATHSPLLASLPGATLMELDVSGIRRVESFEELALVQHWREFLKEPGRYHRHLF